MTISADRIALITRLTDESQRYITNVGLRPMCGLIGCYVEPNGKKWGKPTYPTASQIRISGCAIELQGHEVIIRRAVAMKNPELLRRVTEAPGAEMNIAMLCPRCHREYADDGWAKNLLAKHLIVKYGAQAILDWIESLPMKDKGPYLNYVRAQDLELNTTVTERKIIV